MRLAVALILVASATAPAQAQSTKEPATGADIYHDCHESTEPDPEFTHAAQLLNCVGYIEGAASMARIYELVAKRDDFCVPDGTTTGQILDVTIGYLAALSDEQRGAPAALVVLASLKAAFPCKH